MPVPWRLSIHPISLNLRSLGQRPNWVWWFTHFSRRWPKVANEKTFYFEPKCLWFPQIHQSQNLFVNRRNLTWLVLVGLFLLNTIQRPMGQWILCVSAVSLAGKNSQPFALQPTQGPLSCALAGEVKGDHWRIQLLFLVKVNVWWFNHYWMFRWL